MTWGKIIKKAIPKLVKIEQKPRAKREEGVSNWKKEKKKNPPGKKVLFTTNENREVSKVILMISAKGDIKKN